MAGTAAMAEREATTTRLSHHHHRQPFQVAPPIIPAASLSQASPAPRQPMLAASLSQASQHQECPSLLSRREAVGRESPSLFW